MESNDNATTSERAVKDTGKLFGSQIFVGLSAAVFSAWLNRLLSQEDMALWPICLGLASFINAFSSWGIGDTFLRVVPALLAKGEGDEARAFIRTGVLVNLCAAGVIAGLLYSFAASAAGLLLHDATKVPLVRVMILAALFTALRDRLSWALRALQMFGKLAFLTMFVDTARTPLMVALYFAYNESVRGALLALAIISLVACVLIAVWMRGYLLGSGGLYPLGRLLKLSLPFYGVSIVGFACDRMGYLVIGAVAAPGVLASYFVVDCVAGYLQLLNGAAMSAVTPKLAERGAQDPSGIGRVFTKCTRYLFLGLLPVHVGVAMLAAPVMGLYGGSKYAGSGYILVALCAAVFLEAVVSLHRINIQVFANPWRLFSLNGVYATTYLGTLAALVYPFGAAGACAARVITASVQAVVSARMLRGVVPMRYDVRAVLQSLPTGAAVGLCAGAAALLPHGHIAAVAAGLAAGGAAWVLLSVRRLEVADIDLLIQLIPKRLISGAARERLAARLHTLLARPARSVPN